MEFFGKPGETIKNKDLFSSLQLTYQWTLSRWNIKRTIVVLCSCLYFSISLVNTSSAESLESAANLQSQIQQQSKQSQVKINKLSDETTILATEYRNVLRKTESLKTYNNQLARIVESQKNEIDSYQQQLSEIEITQKEIIPLTLRMLSTLEKFIQLDTPFLSEERQQRLQNLKFLMDRADITITEKYRRVVEAYQIELEYGRTIEAYEGILHADNNQRTVEFLRIGRLALFYLTLDENEVGVWDKNNNRWQVLDIGYRQSIISGIRIARKQAAPDLLTLPVSFPVMQGEGQ